MTTTPGRVQRVAQLAKLTVPTVERELARMSGDGVDVVRATPAQLAYAILNRIAAGHVELTAEDAELLNPAPRNDAFAGLPDQVARLSASGLTSDKLAYRLAHKIAEVAGADPHFLDEAQQAAGIIGGIIPPESEAARTWAKIGEEIQAYYDRTENGREAEREEHIASLCAGIDITVPGTPVVDNDGLFGLMISAAHGTASIVSDVGFGPERRYVTVAELRPAVTPEDFAVDPKTMAGMTRALAKVLS